MYILGFLSILGWVFLLYRWRSKYAAYYPLLTATTVICSLYIGAYLKILSFTSALIFGVGLLLLLKALLQNLKTIVSYRLITRSLKIIPISIVFFVLVGLAWYIFTLKATIFGWDEFFWGQFTKAVLNSNGFYTINSGIFTSKINYPPAIALFQYFFLHFSRFKESGLYFAQGILILSGLSVVFGLAKRSLKTTLGFVLAVASAIVYFGPGLLTIMNDQVLGVIFAGGILTLIFILNSNKSRFLLLPAVFSLPLIKSTGIVLSATIVLLALILTVIRKPDIPKLERRVIPIDKYSLALIIALGLAIILPIKSWDLYVKGQGVPVTPPLPAFSKIENAFSEQASAREKNTTTNFEHALVNLPMNQQEVSALSDQPLFRSYFKTLQKINRVALPIPAWLIIFTFLFGIIYWLQKKEWRNIILALYFSLIFGLVIFLSIHLITYLFYFSEYEGTRLASMDRYIGTYFLAFTLVTIGCVGYFIRENPKKARVIILSSCIIFLFLLIFHTPPFSRLIVPPQLMAASTNARRTATKEFSDYINGHTADTSRIWVIYQNTNGWECMMIRYDIAPRIMNTNNWSLGDKYSADDQWTNRMSAEDWANQIEQAHYNYVFLANVDSNFWSHYSQIFADPVSTRSFRLFAVKQDQSGVSLVANQPQDPL